MVSYKKGRASQVFVSYFAIHLPTELATSLCKRSDFSELMCDQTLSNGYSKRRVSFAKQKSSMLLVKDGTIILH